MTIDKLQDKEQASSESQNMPILFEIQKEVLKEELQGGNTQKQLLQLISSVAPQQQVSDTARNQLSKGFIDIKI